MKFQKKPVTIEAERISTLLEIASKSLSDLPAWVREAYMQGALFFGTSEAGPGWVSVRTLEGDMRGEASDYLIRGVAGELYPCKPEIFEATYTKVAEAQVPDVKPTVGRVVYYYAFGTPGGEYQPGAERAAIVTEVPGDGSKIGLAVMNPTGMFFNREVPYSAEPKPGHWSWMPYQKARQAEEAAKV